MLEYLFLKIIDLKVEHSSIMINKQDVNCVSYVQGAGASCSNTTNIEQAVTTCGINPLDLFPLVSGTLEEKCKYVFYTRTFHLYDN